MPTSPSGDVGISEASRRHQVLLSGVIAALSGLEDFPPALPFPSMFVTKHSAVADFALKENAGQSFIYGTGAFVGGDIMLSSCRSPLKNQCILFDGRLAHGVADF